MSHSDSFIDEVTEEVRRDRLFALYRRWGWVGILAIVLVVGGSGFYEWQQSRKEAASRAFGDELMQAMSVETPADRLSAIETVAPDEAGRRAVRDLLAAAAAIEAGSTDEALSRFDAVAANGELPVALRQLALLKRVILAGPAMPASERGAALDQLSQPGAPYRLLAQEQQALDLVAAGKTEEAVTRLRALLQEAGVTAGLRRRVSQLMVALGADPEAA